MNSSSSGKGLENFLSGKGFYIVLFLCAAVIGFSAWMMTAGNETMGEDALQTSVSKETNRVETVIIPAQPNREPVTAPEIVIEAPALAEDEPIEPGEPADSRVEDEPELSAAVYLWPLRGDVDRGYSGDRLSYDVTMQDWRSHNGIDILAEAGSVVQASCAGTVESIRKDDMLGTVVTVVHSDGSKAIYANLQEIPAVSEGDRVEAGQVIGAVGHSALAEVGQAPHLHFALQVNGSFVDPMAYLAA